MSRGKDGQIFSEFFNEFIFFDGHSWFFDLDQSMVVIKFVFAIAAKVEVITEEALIPDSHNSKLILTAGADNSMHQKFSYFLLLNHFYFLLLYFFFLDSFRPLIKNPCS